MQNRAKMIKRCKEAKNPYPKSMQPLETCRQDGYASGKHVDRFMLSGPNLSTGCIVHGKTCRQL